MLKILQVRLQWDMNCELPSVQAGFWKGTGTRDQIVNIHSVQFSSVQSLSRVRLFETPWLAAHQASLSITNSRSSLRLMSIQPSHPLSSPSPPALNLSQHQGLFQSVNSLHEVAKVLEHHSFQRTPRTDLLQNGLVGAPCSPRDSQESSPTPQKSSIPNAEQEFNFHDHQSNAQKNIEL